MGRSGAKAKKRTVSALAVVAALLVAPPAYAANATPASVIRFTGGDHGAVPVSGVPAAARAITALRSLFWTSLPAMAVELSGVTITNIGSTSCALPAEVSSAIIENGSVTAVRSPYFSVSADLGSANEWPSLLAPAQEFVRAQVPITHGRYLIAVGLPESLEFTQLELHPGGKAVLVIDTDAEPDAASRPVHCIDPPGNGGIRFGLGRETLVVPVPRMPAPAGGSWNPSGSAFYECTSGIISPFITWTQATELVGPGGTGLVSRDSPIWDRAP